MRVGSLYTYIMFFESYGGLQMLQIELVRLT